MRTSVNEEIGTMAENNPLTGFEPNFIDNYNTPLTNGHPSRSLPAKAGPSICMT